MRNPFTALRQALGQLRAEVEGMYQDMLTEERAFAGEPAVSDQPPVDRKPRNARTVDTVSGNQTRRRGRPPKTPSPPPAPPGTPSSTACPDPDGADLPASPVSREPASSRRKAEMKKTQVNAFGVPRGSKAKPWELEETA